VGVLGWGVAGDARELARRPRGRSELDHQLYAVGIDYRLEGNDLVILKSGYYGLF
jgi:hypothetical protein